MSDERGEFTTMAEPPRGMKGTFNKFTERARKVLTLAQEEARRLNHSHVGTEHLLLGLVAEGEGVAAKVLWDLIGIETGRLRDAVEHIIGYGDRPVVGEIGLTRRAKHAVELALEEARRLGHRYVGTEHVLLGLIREGEGIAAQVLEGHSISIEKARAQILRVLAASATAPKGNVVMCRLDDRALDALDTLIEAGVRTTRSDAAAWLIQAGIAANAELFATVSDTVSEIRRLRGVAQRLAREASGDAPTDQPPAEESGEQ